MNNKIYLILGIILIIIAIVGFYNMVTTTYSIEQLIERSKGISLTEFFITLIPIFSWMIGCCCLCVWLDRRQTNIKEKGNRRVEE